MFLDDVRQLLPIFLAPSAAFPESHVKPTARHRSLLLNADHVFVLLTTQTFTAHTEMSIRNIVCDSLFSCNVDNIYKVYLHILIQHS